MLRSPKYVALLAGALALLLTTSHCGNLKPRQTGTMIQIGDPAPGAIGNVISLEQGWTNDSQQGFWFTTQGSEVIPYDYFLYLEQVDSEDLFRSNDHIESYRYLPQNPTPLNPDGLPVGFAKVTDPQSKVDWVGFSCAACHTAQISFKGQGIRIDGAPTLAYYQKFGKDLLTALDATLKKDDKFERFANGVLGPNHTKQDTDKLRTDLSTHTDNLARRALINTSDFYDGYGRVDALGRIFNAVTAYDLDIMENAAKPDAPVSYPFLWDTAQTDFVQWNGSLSNANIGPVVRNVVELLGVFGHVDIDPTRGLKGYESSAQEQDLGILEIWLEELWSPQWPENILPTLEPEKVARGEAHFQTYCARCHLSIDRTNPKRRYPAVMIPQSDIGTDPKYTANFAERNDPAAVATGLLEGHKKYVVAGEEFGARAPVLDIITNVLVGTLLAHKVESVRIGLEDAVRGLPKGTQTPNAIKTRPLDGIWATAPYLHNGSVPTLYDLLLPVDQRLATFYIGSREFDPVKVGYVTTGGPDTFLFDTSLLGNHNIGHTYGTAELSDTEREELVEYLKSL